MILQIDQTTGRTTYETKKDGIHYSSSRKSEKNQNWRIELLTDHLKAPFRNAACKAVEEMRVCKHGKEKLLPN